MVVVVVVGCWLLVVVFDRLNNPKVTAITRLFLEPRTTYIVNILPVRLSKNTPRRPAELTEDGEVKLDRQM